MEIFILFLGFIIGFACGIIGAHLTFKRTEKLLLARQEELENFAKKAHEKARLIATGLEKLKRQVQIKAELEKSHKNQ